MDMAPDFSGGLNDYFQLAPLVFYANAISDDWSGETKALSLVGHTDRSGGDDYNQALSERRVSSVTDALAGTGFAGARISGYGVGESDPAVPTPDGVREPRNRRVIVTLQ